LLKSEDPADPALLSPNRRGQNLTKFKNILYGVYWNQYQGFKTPAFWLNVFFQKAAPPYAHVRSVQTVKTILNANMPQTIQPLLLYVLDFIPMHLI
jgi:hypothetical protein